MSTPKLLLMYAAWLLASGAIALTFAVVLTEVLAMFGIVDRSGASYGLSLNVVTAGTFAVLAVIPFVFRGRFGPDPEEPAGSP